MNIKKWVFFILGLGLLAAIAAPLVNLWLDRQTPEAVRTELSAITDPAFAKAAPIIQGKCAHCHRTGTRPPWYATLPPASILIGRDVKAGLARWDFDGKLSGSGDSFSEIELARLENVLIDNSMPPFRYVAMHWNNTLNEDEKQILMEWIHARRIAMRKDNGVAPEFAGGVLYAIPQTIELDQAKVALGDTLFHDVRLSGDNTMSCASCHALGKGGTDQSKVSTGIRGQKGGINAPTVFNATYNFVQFWDGRAADLAAQAHGPVQNPIEMGATWPQVIAKLSKDAEMVSAFKRLYPEKGMTPDTIADAIVTFERSLITPNSRFDQYLRGDKTALNKTELAGYQLFKQNCASCHAGTNVGGLSYEKMGWRREYFLGKKDLHEGDFGRFNVTQDEVDRHYFKVPTLRNIAVTWPYFHNGSTDDLRQAVEVMATYQVRKELTDTELDQITAFLHTLTGEYNCTPVSKISPKK